MDDLLVTPRLTIPGSELTIRFSRSGGPGGQHVNTRSTRVELVWNVAASEVLADEQRLLLLERLAGRLDGDGNLRVVVDTARSQAENRTEARLRLRAIVSAALHVRRARRPTHPTAASRVRRLEAKRRRAAAKRLRQAPDWD